MKFNDRILSLAILFLLTISALLVVSLAQTQSPPGPPHNGGCTAVLVSFSPCLPYVSSLPNNISDTVSPHCCEVFLPIFQSDDKRCLCYLLRQPHLLGFPLDQPRIRSLSSVCPSRNASAAVTTSMELLCLASSSLPPLRSTTAGLGLPNSSDSGKFPQPSGLGLPNSSDSGKFPQPTGSADSPSSSTSSSLNSTKSIHLPPSPIPEPATNSSSEQQINITISRSGGFRLLPQIMTPLALTFAIFQ